MRHTPVVNLFNDRGKLIGRQCKHCNALMTPNSRPSDPRGERGPNKKHLARLAAANNR